MPRAMPVHNYILLKTCSFKKKKKQAKHKLRRSWQNWKQKGKKKPLCVANGNGEIKYFKQPPKITKRKTTALTKACTSTGVLCSVIERTQIIF